MFGIFGDAGRVPAWKSQSVELRNRMEVDLRYKPWTTTGKKFTGLSKTSRALECIDLAAISHGCTSPAVSKRTTCNMDKLTDVFVDVSQNPCRMAWTSAKMLNKCLTTSSLIYSFGRDSVVLPLELMIWQGHRADISTKGMPQNSLKQLAGQGINLPCLAVVIAAAAACGAFEK